MATAEANVRGESMTTLDLSASWKDSDVILLVEGKEIHCHSQIITMSSPVFETMFSGRFTEQLGTKIELPGKDYETFREFISFLYPQESSDPLPASKALRLLESFHEYDIRSWEKKAEAVLIKFMKKDHAVDCLNLADKCQLKELESRAMFTLAELPLSELQRLEGYTLLEVQTRHDIFEAKLGHMERSESTLVFRSHPYCKICWRILNVCIKGHMLVICEACQTLSSAIKLPGEHMDVDLFQKCEEVFKHCSHCEQDKITEGVEENSWFKKNPLVESGIIPSVEVGIVKAQYELRNKIAQNEGDSKLESVSDGMAVGMEGCFHCNICLGQVLCSYM